MFLLHSSHHQQLQSMNSNSVLSLILLPLFMNNGAVWCNSSQYIYHKERKHVGGGKTCFCERTWDETRWKWPQNANYSALCDMNVSGFLLKNESRQKSLASQRHTIVFSNPPRRKLWASSHLPAAAIWLDRRQTPRQEYEHFRCHVTRLKLLVCHLTQFVYEFCSGRTNKSGDLCCYWLS